MVDVNYQCAVNNAHTKVIPDHAKAVPFYCGKPMNKVQAATASPKPAAASLQTLRPQGPAQKQSPKK